MLTVLVVLPTPPFWLDTVMTRVSLGRGNCRPASSMRRRVSSATSRASGVESSIREMDSTRGCDPVAGGMGGAGAEECICSSRTWARKPGIGSTSSHGRVTETEMAGASVSGGGESFDVDIRTSGRPDEKAREVVSSREPKASAVAYWRSGKGSASAREPSSGSASGSGAAGVEAWSRDTGSREPA